MCDIMHSTLHRCYAPGRRLVNHKSYRGMRFVMVLQQRSSRQPKCSIMGSVKGIFKKILEKRAGKGVCCILV
jgi:hypothetical protein